jgi:hypothetical protein
MVVLARFSLRHYIFGSNISIFFVKRPIKNTTMATIGAKYSMKALLSKKKGSGGKRARQRDTP